MRYIMQEILENRGNTLIERYYTNLSNKLIKQMRDHDLYEANKCNIDSKDFQGTEELITKMIGATQNTKFNWEVLAKMAHYGIDGTKWMLLQTMRHPRGMKRFLLSKEIYKINYLMSDLDNHDKPNLKDVVWWNRPYFRKNYTENLEVFKYE